MAKYDAFISYSRGADAELAPKIREGLQKLAKPWNKRRALNIFLDQASLEVSTGLKDSLEAKLAGTEWLILLLSEESAASQWVGAELDNWLASRPRDRVLLVHTGGELAWGDGDWDWERSTAAPRALSGISDEEPLWLDLRKYHGSADLDIRSNAAFKDDLATLAARLHGKSKEDLVGEDLVQHRRARRLRRAAIAGLAALTVVALGLAYFANVQRQNALREGRISATRQIAAQAQVEATDQPDAALLLAVAATDLDDELVAAGDISGPLVEPRAALLAVLEETPQLIGYLPLASEPTAVAAGTAAGALAVGDAAGAVTVWDPITRQPAERTELAGGAVTVAAMSGTGSVIGAATESGQVTIWEPGSGRTVEIDGGDVSMIAFDDSGELVAVASGDGTVTVHETSDGARVDTFRRDLLVHVSFTGPDRLSLIGFDGAHVVCDVGRGCSESFTPYGGLAQPGPLAFNAAANRGAVSQLTGGSVTAGKLDGEPDLVIELGPGFIEALEFSPDGSTLVAVHESALSFFDTSTSAIDEAERALAEAFSADEFDAGGLPIAEPLPPVVPGVESDVNTGIAFLSDDGSRLATLANGKVQIWDHDRTSRLGTTLPVPKVEYKDNIAVAAADFSPDGSRAAWQIDYLGIFRDGDALVEQEGETIAVWTQDTGEIRTLAAGHEQYLAFVDDDRLFTDGGELWDVVAGEIVAAGGGDCFGPFGVVQPDAAGGLARCVAGTLEPIDLSPFAGAIAGVDLAGATVSDGDGHLAAFTGPLEVTVYPAGGDGTVVNLSADPVALEAAPDAPTLTLSPGGDLLVVSSGSGAFSFWSVDRQALLLSVPRDRIDGMAFSPGGRRVALDLVNGGIELRDTTSLAIIAELQGDGETGARALQYRPDGKVLLEATAGGGLTLWDVDPTSWRRIACSVAARTLTDDEQLRFVSGAVDVDPCRDPARP